MISPSLQDPSNPKDWVAAEGDGQISIDFAGAPTTAHEDYRLHVFAQGYDCQGEKLKNWLFVVPDGVADDEVMEGAARGEGAGARAASEADVILTATNLRRGNLRTPAGSPAPAHPTRGPLAYPPPGGSL